MAVPRIIHCCWFGGGPKPALAERCRESWRRFAPGWEVCEWNDAGPDAPEFVRQAANARKWAFVSDWMRFKVLHDSGGVYFDFDQELTAPIDDLAGREWCAGEWTRGGGAVRASGAGIALEKGSPFAAAMLAHYAQASFDGGVETVGERMERVASANPAIAPELLWPEVFCPIGPDGACHRTAATRGIHHYAMSWAAPRRKIARWLVWHGMRWIVDALLRRKTRAPEPDFDIVHVCAGAEAANGAAAIAAAIARAQAVDGKKVAFVSTSIPPGTPEVELPGVRRIVFARTRIPLLRKLCFSRGMLFGLGRICRNAKIVHTHCQWTFPVWWGAKCARGALVMSPAGSFDPVRMRFGRFKKRIAAFFDRRCLRKAALVHATAEREAEWIRAFEPHVRAVAVAPPDAVPAPPLFALAQARREAAGAAQDARRLRVLYLGRRHPLKGLNLLEKAIEGLDAELRIKSSVSGWEREKAFAWCDILCLPTRSENYGLVVAEALVRGRPVITTRAAPWQGLVEHKCGWWTEPSVQGLRAALAEAAAMPRAELAAMGARGREWLLREFPEGSCWENIECKVKNEKCKMKKVK